MCAGTLFFWCDLCYKYFGGGRGCARLGIEEHPCPAFRFEHQQLCACAPVFEACAAGRVRREVIRGDCARVANTAALLQQEVVRAQPVEEKRRKKGRFFRGGGPCRVAGWRELDALAMSIVHFYRFGAARAIFYGLWVIQLGILWTMGYSVRYPTDLQIIQINTRRPARYRNC